MRLAVCDTSPVNYLVLIGQVNLLPRLFQRVAAPDMVRAELLRSRTPQPVRDWILQAPEWLEFHDPSNLPKVDGLGLGETAAIALAEFTVADLLLIDERAGTNMARACGLRTTGTLGILDLAAERGAGRILESHSRSLRNVLAAP